MSVFSDDRLVVAISSRALFNFEEENRIFESGDAQAYMALQLERLRVGEQFNPEVGFVRRPDIRRTLAEFRFSPRPRSMPSDKSDQWGAGLRQCRS